MNWVLSVCKPTNNACSILQLHMPKQCLDKNLMLYGSDVCIAVVVDKKICSSQRSDFYTTHTTDAFCSTFWDINATGMYACTIQAIGCIEIKGFLQPVTSHSNTLPNIDTFIVMFENILDTLWHLKLHASLYSSPRDLTPPWPDHPLPLSSNYILPCTHQETGCSPAPKESCKTVELMTLQSCTLSLKDSLWSPTWRGMSGKYYFELVSRIRLSIGPSYSILYVYPRDTWLHLELDLQLMWSQIHFQKG